MPDQSAHNKARYLRKSQTDAESLLWSRLRARQLTGIKFRRQHPIGPYVLDFYCAEAHLAVEVDGSQHLESIAINQDQARMKFLENKSIKVIRFWNHEVLENLDAVLESIIFTLDEIMSDKHHQ